MKRTASNFFAMVSSVSIFVACAGGTDDGAARDNAAANDAVQASADALTRQIDMSGIANSAHPFLVAIPFFIERDENPPAAKRKMCGVTGPRTCPTKTVTCDGDKVTSIQLEYKGDRDGNVCTQSGVPITGTLIATRSDAQQLTVTVVGLPKGTWGHAPAGTGTLFNGDVTFKRLKGVGNWEMSMTALAVDMKQNGAKSYDCQASCMSRLAYSLTVGVTAWTQTPITINVERVSRGNKDLIVNGSIYLTGRVSGHLTVWRRGPGGGERQTRDEDFGWDLEGRQVALSAVKYDLPLSCACPTGGTVSTESDNHCGTLTISFAPETRDGKCAVAEAVYMVNGVPNRSELCEDFSEAAEASVNDSCVPFENPRPRK
jgi:hypothetical protein